MSDVLADAEALAQEVRAASCARSVTYRRGQLTTPVQATVGETKAWIDTEWGRQPVRYRDYLIATTELTLYGVPQRGDVIEEVENEQTYSYEVVAPKDEPCWRYSGQTRITMRIHTQEI